ncbi:hypothetical protein BpHYR1_019949 [Brachionus plicatilis]|uniref:Secreted protein n=1 Tax=Brachionus plicatilis TaxID=10195 RepID=A0A3M7S661_BRAPC|nr:hypothetical protein BpHYR1_019949 [Brachionus plicatilis]
MNYFFTLISKNLLMILVLNLVKNSAYNCLSQLEFRIKRIPDLTMTHKFNIKKKVEKEFLFDINLTLIRNFLENHFINARKNF